MATSRSRLSLSPFARQRARAYVIAQVMAANDAIMRTSKYNRLSVRTWWTMDVSACEVVMRWSTFAGDMDGLFAAGLAISRWGRKLFADNHFTGRAVLTA